eukprot:4050275-Karenia_brevis.AAC.1
MKTLIPNLAEDYPEASEEDLEEFAKCIATGCPVCCKLAERLGINQELRGEAVDLISDEDLLHGHP